tara:strand:- start:1824 stop:2138 length:315 start_codon:yes stop_codon:yes gene_type:complete
VKGRLQLLLTQYVEAQQETNRKLDKIAALLISNQLLQECIDHTGQAREADTVAELVSDSYSASLCLHNELDQRNKEYEYQKSEFFVDDTSNEDSNDEGSSLESF